MVHGADDERGDRGGRQCGQRHVGEEGPPGEVQVAENDEVGEVRAGQEQRAGVGEEQAGVEEWGLFPPTAAAGGVDEDGGEERDRRIEIQQRGHRDHEHRRYRRRAARRWGTAGRESGHRRQRDRPRRRRDRPGEGRRRGRRAASPGRPPPGPRAGRAARPPAGARSRRQPDPSAGSAVPVGCSPVPMLRTVGLCPAASGAETAVASSSGPAYQAAAALTSLVSSALDSAFQSAQ